MHLSGMCRVEQIKGVNVISLRTNNNICPIRLPTRPMNQVRHLSLLDKSNFSFLNPDPTDIYAVTIAPTSVESSPAAVAWWYSQFPQVTLEAHQRLGKANLSSPPVGSAVCGFDSRVQQLRSFCSSHFAAYPILTLCFFAKVRAA